MLSAGTIFLSLILHFAMNTKIRNHMTRRGVNPPLQSLHLPKVPDINNGKLYTRPAIRTPYYILYIFTAYTHTNS